MCGRYTLTVDEKFLRELFDIALEDFEYEPHYNIYPGAEVPVVYTSGLEKRRTARPMRWGLIPRWAKEDSVGYKMINARGETVHKRPVFKGAFSQRRCLVPADGFYEWEKTEQGKTPYRITLPDGSVFSFAGLWESRLGPEGRDIYSFTIITVKANEHVGRIHKRMPVILPSKGSWEKWLNPKTPGEKLKQMLVPYEGPLVSYKVSPLVNSPTNNFPELILPTGSMEINE